MSNDSLQGRLRVPYEATTNRVVKRTAAERGEWQRIFRGLPQGALVMPWSQIASSFPTVRAGAHGWIDDLLGMYMSLEAVMQGLFLLGGEYSGRLFGVRVPALLLAVTLSSEGDVRERAALYLDALNRDYQLGLFPAEEFVGERRVYSVATVARQYVWRTRRRRAGGLHGYSATRCWVASSGGTVATDLWRASIGRAMPMSAVCSLGTFAALEAGELWFDLVERTRDRTQGDVCLHGFVDGEKHRSVTASLRSAAGCESMAADVGAAPGYACVGGG